MCGIIGFVGSNPNLEKLKILALYNDERGGDSCGFAINNEIFKYANITDDTFKKAFSKHAVLKNFVVNNPKKNQTILMHTRKSSIGHSIESNAHPFLVEYGDRKLIGVHNGTIKNIEDLSHKYLTDEEMKHFRFSTDSEVLFYIMVKNNNYDILTEYEGGAALLWYDPDKPDVIYGFKGASPSTIYHGFSSMQDFGDVEERPLHLTHLEGGVYFSSLMEPLNAIGAELGKVLTLKANTVYSFNYKGVLDTIPIKRIAPYYRPKPVSALPPASSKLGVKSPRLNNFLWNINPKSDLYLYEYQYYSKGEIMHGVYYVCHSHVYQVADYTALDLEFSKDLSFPEFYEYMKKVLMSYGLMHSGNTDEDYIFFYNGYILDPNLSESYSSLIGFLHKIAKRGEKTFFYSYLSEFCDYSLTPVFTTQPGKVHGTKFRNREFAYPYTGITIKVGMDNCISETKNEFIQDVFLKLKESKDVAGTSYSERLGIIEAKGGDWAEVVAISEQQDNYYAFVNPKKQGVKADVYFRIPYEGFLTTKAFKDFRSTTPTEDIEDEVDLEEELYVTFVTPLPTDLRGKGIIVNEAYEVINALKDSHGNIISMDVQVGDKIIPGLYMGIDVLLVEEEDVDNPFYSSDDPAKVERFLRKENKKRKLN